MGEAEEDGERDKEPEELKQRCRDRNRENGNRETQRQRERAGPELQSTSSLALVVKLVVQKLKWKHDSGLMGVAHSTIVCVCGREGLH